MLKGVSLNGASRVFAHIQPLGQSQNSWRTQGLNDIALGATYLASNRLKQICHNFFQL